VKSAAREAADAADEAATAQLRARAAALTPEHQSLLAEVDQSAAEATAAHEKSKYLLLLLQLRLREAKVLGSAENAKAVAAALNEASTRLKDVADRAAAADDLGEMTDLVADARDGRTECSAQVDEMEEAAAETARQLKTFNRHAKDAIQSVPDSLATTAASEKEAAEQAAAAAQAALAADPGNPELVAKAAEAEVKARTVDFFGFGLIRSTRKDVGDAAREAAISVMEARAACDAALDAVHAANSALVRARNAAAAADSEEEGGPVLIAADRGAAPGVRGEDGDDLLGDDLEALLAAAVAFDKLHI
jgi:hypothetical protein